MEYLERRRELVQSRLVDVLGSVEPPELRDELEHVTLSGGKRVRPVVAVLACEAAGGETEDALDYAVGVELVHNASLVVDDIIDESEVRRGTPSAWVEFGYGPAVVSSDGLIGEALELFKEDPAAMQAITDALVELGEGEATELLDEPETEAEYMELARRKTGALFRVGAELGAMAAGADGHTVEAFGEYAERVGIAFQIRDDVLDATADAEDLGKPTGQDAEMERPSVVEVTDLTPEEANERAHEQSDAALAALERADGPTDDEARAYLRDLAEFVVVRER
jgi:geranylgeranyl diphosphate synthase type I